MFALFVPPWEVVVVNFDVLLRDAVVAKGDRAGPQTADVAVSGGLIAAVGDLAAAAAERVVDCAGLLLCPGFIDLHTHSDMSLLGDPRGESKVLQGVTTEVTGNCGFSPFPIAPERRGLHEDLLKMIGIGDEAGDVFWSDLDGYATVLQERRPSLNVVPLLGHGSLRIAAMGVAQRPAGPGELLVMERLLDAALEQGAFGLSTGLTYVPSGFASPQEIAALAHGLARKRRLYATHARVTAGHVLTSIEEAVEVGRETGARVQYSHIALNEPDWWGRADDVLGRFDQAARDGLDVAFDVYPYTASSSAFTQFLPAWLVADGEEAMRHRLGDRVVRRRAERDLSKGWAGGIPWLWDRVVIASSPGDPTKPGHTVRALAEQAGRTPEQVVLELCARHGNRLHVIFHYRVAEDVRAFLRHPCAVVGSDGNALPLAIGDRRPHPRSYGTYPRILAAYVRDGRHLDLADAVHKMTGAAADRVGLRDRGRVAPGLAADLVVLDLDALTDHATFETPARPPTGVHHVLVNGEFVVEGGRHTGRGPGRVLRAVA